MRLFTTKAQLRQIIRYQEERIEQLEDRNRTLNREVDVLERELDSFNYAFPLDLGEIVYDVQLRSANGRYTKTKASRSHSLINEVVVDKKNYFNLVDRFNKKDIFLDKDEAVEFLNSVCID